jgi:hypothetical protein
MNPNPPVIKRGDHTEIISEETKTPSKDDADTSLIDVKDIIAPSTPTSTPTSTHRISQKKRLIPLNKVVTHLQSKPFLTTYWR